LPTSMSSKSISPNNSLLNPENENGFAITSFADVDYVASAAAVGGMEMMMMQRTYYDFFTVSFRRERYHIVELSRNSASESDLLGTLPRVTAYFDYRNRTGP
jgi:hypothetical protein